MKEEFQARMLRIHSTEADKWQGKPLHEAIVAKCQELGLAGATVYRGLEGFGASARIYHARRLSFSKYAPIMVCVIDTEDQIQKLLPRLDQMISGAGCQLQQSRRPARSAQLESRDNLSFSRPLQFGAGAKKTNPYA